MFKQEIKKVLHFAFFSICATVSTQVMAQSSPKLEQGIKVNSNLKGISTVDPVENFKQRLRDTLQAEYKRIGFPVNSTVYVNFSFDDVKNIYIRDKVLPPLFSDGQSSNLQNNAQKLSAFSPSEVFVGGVLYSGGYANPPTFSINHCNNVDISGNVQFNFLGQATSTVYLERDSGIIKSSATQAWLWGNFKHSFGFSHPLSSGIYRLRHKVWTSGDDIYPFQIINNANCAVPVSISMRGHVQSDGWHDWVGGGQTVGTTGQSKRLEAIEVKRSSPSSGFSICYDVKIENDGWSGSRCDGSQAGTTNQGKRIEKIKVWLENAPAGCGVVYKTYIGKWLIAANAGLGWTGQSSNGSESGTSKTGQRIEAVNIALDGC
jgi:Clostridial hydrophobic W